MSIVEQLISVYAPHTCIGCDREGRILCVSCSGNLPVPSPRCYRCHDAMPRGLTCRACRPHSYLISVNCATAYSGVAKDLLWRLKFGRAQSAAVIMGELLAERFAPALRDDVLIVPVPTARRRVRMRGYDQAELLARALAKHTGCRYSPLLVRLGKQEQKGAGRQQRHEQLRNAIKLKSSAAGKVRQARIILVDDVLTTGATLEQAAGVLHQAGAKAIGGLVFARA